MTNNNNNPVHLPDPTPWPMVMALGMTLFGAGLVTHLAATAVGAALLGLALLMLIREDIASFDGGEGA